VHGNVWEWCRDGQIPHESAEQDDPEGLTAGSNRVIRGGSWINNAQGARSAYRDWYGLGFRDNALGFRCLSLVKVQAERVSASRSEPSDEAAEKRRTK
jgi:formylglycine-generating enzyme required for sulfatase activity